jgi:hypothetical protein
MAHTIAGRGRRNVRDEEAELDTVHDNPSASTRHMTSVCNGTAFSESNMAYCAWE